MSLGNFPDLQLFDFNYGFYTPKSSRGQIIMWALLFNTVEKNVHKPEILLAEGTLYTVFHEESESGDKKC